jgi:hypothetical protein
MADQTEITDAIRELDRKILILEHQGKLTSGSFYRWNLATSPAVSELLNSVRDEDENR